MLEMFGLVLVNVMLADSGAVVPAAGPLPADLRLEWREPAASIEGEAGETLEIGYRLRNVGGRDAFAAVIKTYTSLGASQQPERLQPGPKAGTSAERKLAIALATGMRELCVEAMLQNLNADEPPDSNLRDNRICRPMRVRPTEASAGGAGEEP